jgi:tRNA (guanine37-N1)-methyltransferase
MKRRSGFGAYDNDKDHIMKIDILTLFPEMFDAVISAGVIGRAAERGLLEFCVTNIRDHTTDKHRKADDYPFGGGAGQLMTAQPIFDALRSIGISPGGLPAPETGTVERRLIYMSPRGRLLDGELAEELSREQALVLLCGHYEGVDQRALDAFGFEEVSVGDYILTGGELPSMILIDAVCRLVPGVLGSEDSHTEESIYSGLLEYPQYTRPASFEGMDVPDVLISGDHAKIALWNFEQALALTAKRRPDLLRAWLAAHYDSLDKKRKKIADAYTHDC